MNQEKIGKFIFENRKKIDLTQEELAEKLGVSKNAVSKWERGLNLPDASIMQKLCCVLNITLNELFAGEFIENISIDSEKNMIEVLQFRDAEKRKLKIKTIIAGIIILFISFFIILLLYFKTNYNKIKVYELYGESEKFQYSEGLFITSNIQNILSYGKINIRDGASITMEDVHYIAIKCGNLYIVGGGIINTFPQGYIDEKYGYNEIFSENKIANIGDWKIEITYTIGDEIYIESIPLKYKQIIKNNNFVVKRNEAISDDTEYSSVDYNRFMIENRKALESKGFIRKKTYDLLTKKIRPSYYDSFIKKLENGSTLTVTYAGMFIFEGEDYDVRGSLMSSIYTLDSNVEEKSFSYLYNFVYDTGSCISGECPVDAIEFVREFDNLYRPEIKDLFLK